MALLPPVRRKVCKRASYSTAILFCATISLRESPPASRPGTLAGRTARSEAAVVFLEYIQMPFCDHLVRQEHRPPDGGAELADISRPGVAEERAHGRLGKTEHGFFQFLVCQVEEPPGQIEQVLLALAQRRDAKGKFVQPVEQVGPQPSRRHGRIQILVARRQHAHVNLDGLRAADAAKGLFLQGPEHFGLRGQRHVQNLVQEEGAAVGQFKPAGLAAGRAGKRPLFVPEQFRLEKGVRNGARVHRHEGTFGAGTAGVDGLGDDFLAGAGFADDDDAEAGFGDAVRSLMSRPMASLVPVYFGQIMAGGGLAGELLDLQAQLALGQGAVDDADRS